MMIIIRNRQEFDKFSVLFISINAVNVHWLTHSFIHLDRSHSLRQHFHDQDVLIRFIKSNEFYIHLYSPNLMYPIVNIFVYRAGSLFLPVCLDSM